MLHHSSLHRKAVLVVNPESDRAMRVIQLLAASIGVVGAFVPKHPTLIRSSAACLQYRRPTMLFHQVNHFRVRQPRPELCVSAPSGTKLGEREDRGAGVIGIIVCDHGSRRENANEMLFEVAERYRAFAGFDIVESAHMELASPSIDQAFDRCVAAGAQKIVLHPFFLSPGRHVTSDIPGLMAAAAKKHPDVAWMVSDPLGLQELMPRLMHAAVSESVEQGAWRFGDGGETVIVE